jgi:hypothetical protein
MQQNVNRLDMHLNNLNSLATTHLEQLIPSHHFGAMTSAHCSHLSSSTFHDQNSPRETLRGVQTYGLFQIFILLGVKRSCY